jgi:glycerophosphoryl diester phosphodiesterase
MKAWHTAGLPINAWTVDDDAELRRLDALGVDGVFCNDPGHAKRVFDGT